jgi:hypothetical protein
MDAPDTVVDALRLLKEQGYELEFDLRGAGLRCDVDDRICPVGDAIVEKLFRFEGPSDPGDEMIVFGLMDPLTGRRGVLASGFGPSADPEVLDQLVGMTTRYGMT